MQGKGLETWGPCPLCGLWTVEVDWDDFPKDVEFEDNGLTILVHFRAMDVTDAVEDAIYEHLEEEHPYWRQDYPAYAAAYDPETILINRRRRRVETIDLLRGI